MAKKVKAPATPVNVPQSRDEASTFIAAIGAHQRTRQRIEALMNDRFAAIKAEFEAQAKIHADAIARLTQGLEVWAAANRAALTDNGKTKTAELATGELRWRMTPPAVSLRNVVAIIAALKKKRLKRFIRVKEEVDKEAIRKEPEAVKAIAGITIDQHEEFVVVPFETKLEEVA